MKGRFTQYGARQLLGRLATPDLFTDLPGVYVAQTVEIPTDSDSGASLVEPTSETAYSRVWYPFGSSHWVNSGYATFVNSQTITYPTATALWPNITGFALTTNVVGGDVIAFGRSWVGRLPQDATLYIPTGGIQVTLRGASL